MTCIRWTLMIVVVFMISVVSRTTTADDPKKILCFGGNGMIGSAAIQALLNDTDHEYEIVLAARGEWRFDTAKTIKPFVRHISCDRDIHIGNCKELMEDIRQTKQYYAVIDFSGTEVNWVADAISKVRNKVRVYIYISSDSIYEVCEPLPDDEEPRKTLETDAVRPTNPQLRNELNQGDIYGNDKLRGEELLMRQRTVGQKAPQGFPYVFLRFADVIGPRDGTERFIHYMTWAKYHHLPNVPSIHVPHDVVEASSLTYVQDAAQSILLTLHEPDTWDEAYNIACEEVFNVTAGIELIARLVGADGPVIPWKDENEETVQAMYPSITRGPVDVTKAKERLGFKPTPLEEALKATIAWYETHFFSSAPWHDGKDNDQGYETANKEEFLREHLEFFVGDVMHDEDQYTNKDRKQLVKNIWNVLQDEL